MSSRASHRRTGPAALMVLLLVALLLLASADPSAAAQAPRSAEILGHSVQGRPLRLVRIGDPAARVRVLVVGCIHGTERAGLAVTRALRRVVPPAATQLLVLDELNPDGCATGTRGNARGVDLNRNFPRDWRRQGGLYASGPGPASEPETRAILRAIVRERPTATIWFHQHMDLVVLTDGADPAVVRRYARTAGMRTGRLGPLPGTASAWQNHRLAATSAFVVELPAGSLAPAAVLRHVAAVRAVATAAAATRAAGSAPERMHPA